jgi:phosphoadenosine phosphosulfate reductase
LAGVPVEWWFNCTTVDPPQLIKFIKEHHPETRFAKPARTMIELIEHNKIPPLRQLRYCCRELKERGGIGRVVITGVRWAESRNRAKRRKLVERFSGRWVVNPIIDWSTDEVWDCIRENNIPYCELYDQGCDRIGCVLCPNGGAEQMARDIAMWPRIARRYLKGCEKAYAACIRDGDDIDWIDGTDMFCRWATGERMRRYEKADEGCLLFE